MTTGNITEKDLKVYAKVDKFLNGYKGDSTIRLGDRYIIRLISHRNKIEAEMCFLEKSNKKTDSLVFNANIKESIAVKCIIKLKKDEIYTPPGTIINKYIIIGDKSLKFP